MQITATQKDRQYYKFCAYGFLKNLRFFDAFLLLFLIENGVSYTQIGFLYAIREITTTLLEVPSGILADSYGRKNALLGSFVAYMISFAFFHFATDFSLFFVAFALYGVADAFRSGTNKGMIVDYLAQQSWSELKVSYYGHTRSWSQMGSAISSIFAGFIVFYSGNYGNIFVYSILPYLINFGVILSYPNAINKSKKTTIRRRNFRTSVNDFFGTVKQPNVLKIIQNAALHSAYLKAIKDYIQPLMIQVVLLMPFLMMIDPKKKNGLVIGLIYFGIYLLTSQASKSAGRLNNANSANQSKNAKLTLVLGLTFGILTGIFYVFDLWILALIAFIGIYLIENLRKPILTGFVAENVPTKVLTTVLSAQSLLKTIFTAGLALTFGFLADYFGIGVSFVLVSVFLVLLTIFQGRQYFLLTAQNKSN